MSEKIILWQKPDKPGIPADLETVEDVVRYAKCDALSEKQQTQIINAFDQGSYEMAAEFAWKKAILKLRRSLERLGVGFLAELMGRSDINDFTPVDDFLTDRKAIELAEQLGIVGKTGALKLRQHYELIHHFLTGDSDEDITKFDSFYIIYDSVQYILCEQDEEMAIAFSEFRERLLSQTVSLSDSDVQQVLSAPLFYIRTVCIILLNAIKKDKGMKQECAIRNLNSLIEEMWDLLGDEDKYSVGFAYSSVIAYGDDVAAKGLKQALLKVHGFDYVPETTRSEAFKNQARRVIDTHYAFQNFYNEPAAVRSLEKLGSVIPSPAFQDCLDAYLIVYLGNQYNISINAAPIAEKELLKISVDRWQYYFKRIIHQDSYVLEHIDTDRQIDRFSSLLARLDYTSDDSLSKANQLLFSAIIKRDYLTARNVAKALLNKLRYPS